MSNGANCWSPSKHGELASAFSSLCQFMQRCLLFLIWVTPPPPSFAPNARVFVSGWFLIVKWQLATMTRLILEIYIVRSKFFEPTTYRPFCSWLQALLMLCVASAAQWLSLNSQSIMIWKSCLLILTLILYNKIKKFKWNPRGETGIWIDIFATQKGVFILF